MFRRRGCLVGCGGMLIVCMVTGLLGWFVIVPRVVDSLQDGLGDSLATVIADDVSPRYTVQELQQGQDVEFPFTSINTNLSSSDDGSDISNVDNVTVVGRGDEMVVTASLNGEKYEIAFLPSATADGRLKLEPVDSGGWFQDKVMDVLSGGFEQSVNTWLSENGLLLTDVSVSSDGLILSVLGE